MPILSGYQLSHSFGADDLFDQLSFTLNAKERVGLVGPNGVGKTTLLLILSGELDPEEGELAIQNELSIGYLRQEAVLTFSGQENTIYDEMLSVFAELTDLEDAMRQMEARMSAGETEEKLFSDYSDAQTAYEAAGGYEYQLKIKQVLEGLGFPQESWQTTLPHLSGGQKTRVLLGRLLLESPDLLILDEPTNHLDSEAVEWLERTLRTYPGTLLIVSHDRYFLDRVTNRIWEMSADALLSYRGNYSSYIQQRQAEFERQVKLFEAEKERLSREIDWVRRHIAGGKTDMAKGKLKRLTRDLVLIDEFGIGGTAGKPWIEVGGRVRTFSVNEAAERVRNLRPPDNRPPRLNIRLQSREESALLVLKTQRLQIGYPETFLFKTEKLRLEKYDCVALIGPNGSGKSTFLKTLLGDVEPLRGHLELGDNVNVGYFAQAHEQLNPTNTVLVEVMRRFELGEQEARTHLGAYLFKADDVFKQVSALSGGERGRLALAILALEGANLLLLDEPTNHLDIPSQEVLQEVLERFDGTILLVSHDRYLIDQLATQIWFLDGDALKVFDGAYSDFLAAQRESELTASEKGDRGHKISIKNEGAATEAKPVDVSWVSEIEAEPVAQIVPKKKRRNTNSATQRLEAYLDKLYEELELAQAAGDVDEIDFLQEEIDTTEEQLAIQE